MTTHKTDDIRAHLIDQHGGSDSTLDMLGEANMQSLHDALHLSPLADDGLETKVLIASEVTLAERDDECRRWLGDLEMGSLEIFRDVLIVHVVDGFGQPAFTIRLAQSTAPEEVLGIVYALEMALAPYVAGGVEQRIAEVTERAYTIGEALDARENLTS